MVAHSPELEDLEAAIGEERLEAAVRETEVVIGRGVVVIPVHPNSDVPHSDHEHHVAAGAQEA